MPRVIFWFILIALFVGAGLSRAQATVNSSLSASPSAYTGTCPTDITFNGTIYLSNTGTLQYRFVRSDGSTSPKTGKYSTTYPAGGATNKVADVWYQVRSNGNDKLEVYYNNTIFLQSQTASFMVACKPSRFEAVTSASNIGRSETARGLSALRLQAPTNLQSSKDPQLCGKHLPIPLFAERICADAMDTGKLVLIWDASNSQPDGYRVYPSRTSGTPSAIATTNGAASTMVPIDPNASPTGCYFVTAFLQGISESEKSGDLCVGNFTPGLPTYTHILSPDLMRSVYHEYDWSCILCQVTHQDLHLSLGPETSHVDVGFLHYYESGAHVINTANQGAVRFGLSRLAGKSVISASLSFTRIAAPPASNEYGVYDYSTLTNCLAAVSLAKEDWSYKYGWIAREDYITNIPWGAGDPALRIQTGDVNENGSRVTVDVTGAVRDWLQGVRDNFGFVLVSGNENTGANDNDYCLNRFGNFALTVKTVGGAP